MTRGHKPKAVAFPADRQPWHRWEDETSEAYEAFCQYLDMGTDRSHAKLGRERDCSRANVSKWSSRWHWVERVHAYEHHLAELAREPREKAIQAVYGEIVKEYLPIIKRLIKIAKGEIKSPSREEVTAGRDLIDRLGAVAPKEILVKGELTLEHLILQLAEEEAGEGDDEDEIEEADYEIEDEPDALPAP